MFVTAIVPAAGQSSRMKADKLALVYKDRPIIERTVTSLLSAGCVDETIVVVAPDSRLPVDRTRCRVVVNADCADGMGTSLRAGVSAASSETDAYLIALADMPEITAPLVETLVDAFSRSGRGILVPFFDGTHGHPVLFGSAYRDELLRLKGDVGARSIVRRHAAAVERFCTDDPAVVFDVDTAESLTLRRIEFPSTESFSCATAVLRTAGIWHQAEAGCSGAGVVGLAYYGYDEARILSLCPDGIVAD